MKKLLVFTLIFTLFFSSIAFGSFESANKVEEFSKNSTPPNEVGITKLLMKKGVIDKNSTTEAIEKAVNEYIKKKLVKNVNKSDDKRLLLDKLTKSSTKNIEYGNILHGRKMGKKVTDIEGVVEKKYDGKVREAKLLILLAEFGDDNYGIGPLHNEIPKPNTQEEADTDLWVEDFSKDFYQNMLFSEGGCDALDYKGETLHLDSMRDYYLEMSNNSYKVSGEVYGWYKLPHSEAYYGDDDEERGGHDNKLPGTTKDLVGDLLKIALEDGVPFEDYDLEDPYDIDEDGNFDEPDGIIDHLVIVHAGIDQSGGGGAQGNNAIWAHSSSVWEEIEVEAQVPYWNGNMVAYNYIIQGENGGIGVFCHEFGHDIGLPDEYDTIYSGAGDTVGFYSLMSSGSWTGKPLGTKPSPMSPWARWALGQIWGGQWVQPTEINYKDITKDGTIFKLDQTTSWGNNEQVVKVNLPKKIKVMTAPFEGEYEFYSGKGDEIDNTIARSVSLPEASSISLEFMTWYNIEKDWDFGFVQISTDGGSTWTSLSTDRTTDTIVPDGYPAIKENMPGYTGSSNGWVKEVIDLKEYAGQDIMIQFRYMTDWGTTLEGMFVDNIRVIADENEIFNDGAENGISNWNVHGWQISEGYEEKNHYYLLEWRNHNNTDEALKYAYNWVENNVEFFNYNSGMLVWYRDTSYSDNWVGIHPGNGFLSIVDSHPEPMVANGVPIRTRIQTHDAAFNLDRVEDKVFTFYGKSKTFQSKQAVPEFNDAHSYWNKKAPSSGVKVPNYGLKFRVIGHSPDYTVGEIGIYK